MFDGLDLGRGTVLGDFGGPFARVGSFGLVVARTHDWGCEAGRNRIPLIIRTDPWTRAPGKIGALQFEFKLVPVLVATLSMVCRGADNLCQDGHRSCSTVHMRK